MSSTKETLPGAHREASKALPSTSEEGRSGGVPGGSAGRSPAELFLWCFSGAIWWLCVHSMTLLFPLPGPWLPVEIAVPIGVLMGLAGWYLEVRPEGVPILLTAGLAGGAAGGWNSARGAPAGEVFLLPSLEEQFLAVVVCALLGLGANLGLDWSLQRWRRQPMRLFGFLLSLVSLMLAAVTVVTLWGTA